MGHNCSKPSFLTRRKEKNPKPSLILGREEINPEASVIPVDVIEEILSRLPAKSVLKFRCVSKTWCSLIDSEPFAKKHLQNIKKIKSYDHWRALFNCTEHGLKQCSMKSFNDDSSIVPSSINDPKNNHLVKGKGVILVAHCNGLMCILKEPGSFFLWNPTTRISIELPRIELSVTKKYGFGWDEGSDAFKVFVVVSEKEENVGKVYSTKTNSWKTVDHGCLCLRSNGQYGKFASGKIHWLKESGREIETFDLNSEVFGMIDQPGKPEVGESMSLYESTHGCLGVACESTKNNKTHWRLLVMEQYAGKESLVERVATNDKKKKKNTWVEKKASRDKTLSCCQFKYYYIESLVSPTSEKYTY